MVSFSCLLSRHPLLSLLSAPPWLIISCSLYVMLGLFYFDRSSCSQIALPLRHHTKSFFSSANLSCPSKLTPASRLTLEIWRVPHVHAVTPCFRMCLYTTFRPLHRHADPMPEHLLIFVNILNHSCVYLLLHTLGITLLCPFLSPLFWVYILHLITHSLPQSSHVS